MTLKAVIAFVGIFLILLGRFCIYRVTRLAVQGSNEGTISDRIKANPRLHGWYRFGQSHYLMGVAAFAACFFI